MLGRGRVGCSLALPCRLLSPTFLKETIPKGEVLRGVLGNDLHFVKEMIAQMTMSCFHEAWQ